jgi:hypothetical protein
LDDAAGWLGARRGPYPTLQSNFRISSNSEGANCRPAAFVTWTRHPDLKSMRALATVSVGLVSCTSALSPSFEDDIVKPILFGGTGRAIRGSSAMLSKMAFGLFAGGSVGGVANIGTGRLDGSGAVMSALTSALAGGPAAARGFDNLNHSTPLSTLSAVARHLLSPD